MERELPTAKLTPHPTNPNILMDEGKGIAYYLEINQFHGGVRLIKLNKNQEVVKNGKR